MDPTKVSSLAHMVELLTDIIPTRLRDTSGTTMMFTLTQLKVTKSLSSMEHTTDGTILPLMTTLDGTDGSMLKLMTTATVHGCSINIKVSMDQQLMESTLQIMMLAQTSLTTSPITMLDGSILPTTLKELTSMVNMTN